jgi:hypothetical protein
VQVVSCEITRFVSAEPQPGWVEAVLTDAGGRRWLFHDKPPIFKLGAVGPSDMYPLAGWLRCNVVEGPGSEGRVVIETVHCESVEGQSRFVVGADTVIDR